MAVGGMSLVEALIQTADPETWAGYCRLAARLDSRPAVKPSHAPGSVEWQEQQSRSSAAHASPPSTAEQEAGRRRLARRGAPLPFAGAPPPFGAAGAEAYDAFLSQYRGDGQLLSEIDALEQRLVGDFTAVGRSGRLRLRGFQGGGETEIKADWFGRVRLDFDGNAVVLPDRSHIGGIVAAIDAPAEAANSGMPRERRSQTILRQALTALWQRNSFTAGTGNERVLALVIAELGLSAADPPYGFKSAETIRKLRKALKM